MGENDKRANWNMMGHVTASKRHSSIFYVNGPELQDRGGIA